MDLRYLGRLRGPLVAAISTLMLTGGISVALAGDPVSQPASTSNAAEEPASTGPDTDLVEFEDQSGAADGAEADSGAPDTDNVQDESGDQVEDGAPD